VTKKKDLQEIEHNQSMLTKRQSEILIEMRDAEDREDWAEAEIIYERGMAFLGDTRIAARTVFALIRACAISASSDSVPGSVEHYTINGTGRDLVKGKK